jgi:hypothetical protein
LVEDLCVPFQRPDFLVSFNSDGAGSFGMFPTSFSGEIAIPELKAIIQARVNLRLKHQPAAGTAAGFSISRELRIVLPIT